MNRIPVKRSRDSRSIARGLQDLLLTGCLAAFGCQSWHRSHSTAIREYSAGNLTESQAQLRRSQDSLRAERELLILDEAIVSLASGDAETAESLLRGVRRDLEHLGQKDLTEQAAAILTDDRAAAFAGRDFEQQMVLNLLLLSSLMTGAQDAFAYSLQATRKTADRKDVLLAESQKSAAGLTSTDNTPVIPAGFPSPAIAPPTGDLSSAAVPKWVASAIDQPLALSAYLSAAVQSEFPLRAEETHGLLQELSLWNPEFAAAAGSGEFGTRCAPGHGTLHILALVGNAPAWESESAAPTSAALLLADRILSATGRHTLPPTVAPVRISRPRPALHNTAAGSLRCEVTGRTADPGTASRIPLELRCLVDLNAVAEASYQQHRDEQIARAVTRRVMKKASIYLLKEAQNIHRNSAVDLAVNVAGIAWEATEKPDTRSWRLLPGRVDVAHIELAAGEWEARVNSVTEPAAARTFPVQIEDGRNTYVVCFVPGDQLTGQILVGGADHDRVSAAAEPADSAR